MLMPYTALVVSAKPENGSKMRQPVPGNLYTFFSALKCVQTKVAEWNLKNLAKMDLRLTQKLKPVFCSLRKRMHMHF